MSSKLCIIIVGPTASGKTAVSIQLAHYFNTEIISADSRQCFKELNIGVAKPSARQLQEVKHYFINSHSIYEEVNAGVFEEYALDKIDTIFKKHDNAVMVGGTGLYIKAFCEGIDDVPPAPKQIREEIESAYKEFGLEWMQQEVRAKDPEFYSLYRTLESYKKTIGEDTVIILPSGSPYARLLSGYLE